MYIFNYINPPFNSVVHEKHHQQNHSFPMFQSFSRHIKVNIFSTPQFKMQNNSGCQRHVDTLAEAANQAVGGLYD